MRPNFRPAGNTDIACCTVSAEVKGHNSRYANSKGSEAKRFRKKEAQKQRGLEAKRFKNKEVQKQSVSEAKRFRSKEVQKYRRSVGGYSTGAQFKRYSSFGVSTSSSF